MREAIKISNQFIVGPQPVGRDYERLQREGIRSIVNLRTGGEDGGAHSPREEAQRAAKLGMGYHHEPISIGALQFSQIDRLRNRLKVLPAPIYLHGGSGDDDRAGAVVVMHLGAEEVLGGKEALIKGEQRGYTCRDERLRAFIADYCDHRPRG